MTGELDGSELVHLPASGSAIGTCNHAGPHTAGSIELGSAIGHHQDSHSLVRLIRRPLICAPRSRKRATRDECSVRCSRCNGFVQCALQLSSVTFLGCVNGMAFCCTDIIPARTGAVCGVGLDLPFREIV